MPQMQLIKWLKEMFCLIYIYNYSTRYSTHYMAFSQPHVDLCCLIVKLNKNRIMIQLWVMKFFYK